MGFTSITVTATYVAPPGAATPTGTVAFALPTALIDSSTGKEMAAFTETATLNGSGAISIVLPANDDGTTVPQGTSYVVTETISGQPVHTKNLVVLHSALGATMDLHADLVP